MKIFAPKTLTKQAIKIKSTAAKFYKKLLIKLKFNLKFFRLRMLNQALNMKYPVLQKFINK